MDHHGEVDILESTPFQHEDFVASLFLGGTAEYHDLVGQELMIFHPRSVELSPKCETYLARHGIILQILLQDESGTDSSLRD